MARATAERVIELLGASPAVETVDITGGAPELNPTSASSSRACAARVGG